MNLKNIIMAKGVRTADITDFTMREQSRIGGKVAAFREGVKRRYK
jgi:hypothetical protein